jgi:GxxExxY protein
LGLSLKLRMCRGRAFGESLRAGSCGELKLRGIAVSSQIPFQVMYKGVPVGDYMPDLLVEDNLIVEVKCVDRLRDEHLASA